MSTERADAELADFLGELDAEFGKKARKKGSGEAPHKALNRAFHEANPQLGQGPKGQLERMRFESYYDWEMHRQAMLDGELERMQAAGVEQLQWLPEARVTYLITQTCACCNSQVQFTGNEYIRFRGRRRNFRTLEGEDRWTWPTRLQRVSEVDGNLVMYGLPGGDPLPDLVEELEETVPRCPGCVKLEQAALNLWIAATQPPIQKSLDDSLEVPGL